MDHQTTAVKTNQLVAKKSGAEIVVKVLRESGVKTVFGYPGGKIIPVFDELFKHNEIKLILCRHEQAAVHAADGYARYSGKTGVCIVTSGPGATNTITGLATAKADSTPVICISGQVETHLLGTEAFQEADIERITAPVTKASYLIEDTEQVRNVMEMAFTIAASGRPGPVSIDLPVDVQINTTEDPGNKDVHPKSSEILRIQEGSEGLFHHFEFIKKFKSPLFFIGGGAKTGAWKDLTTLVHMTGIPVITSLMGIGCISSSHKMALGMIGMHGSIPANLAVSNCDLIIGVGVRFDDRATGNIDSFAPGAEIIHVDIDPDVIGKNITRSIPIVEDGARFFKAFLDYIDGYGWDVCYREWQTQIDSFKARKKVLEARHQSRISSFHPRLILDAIKAQFPGAPLATEVGQHQMWTAQYYDFNEPRHWITSGGQGTMGFGLPAAVGIQTAVIEEAQAVDGSPERCIVIAGDGSIQMNIQELAVCAQRNLPVLIIILNNGYLGMVRQWQELFFDRRYSSTCLQGSSNCRENCSTPGNSCPEYTPNFAEIARGFGIQAARVHNIEDLSKTLRQLKDGPAVVECMIHREENVWPIVPSGRGNHEMLFYGEKV